MNRDWQIPLTMKQRIDFSRTLFQSSKKSEKGFPQAIDFDMPMNIQKKKKNVLTIDKLKCIYSSLNPFGIELNANQFYHLCQVPNVGTAGIPFDAMQEEYELGLDEGEVRKRFVTFFMKQTH